jgi:hypothetical protein
MTHPKTTHPNPTPWSFTAHPAAVGESYLDHLRSAAGFGARMLLGGLACLVHGVLPFLFVRTGSTIVLGLHDRMVVDRQRPHAGSRPVGI